MKPRTKTIVSRVIIRASVAWLFILAVVWLSKDHSDPTIDVAQTAVRERLRPNLVAFAWFPEKRIDRDGTRIVIGDVTATNTFNVKRTFRYVVRIKPTYRGPQDDDITLFETP